MPRMITLSQIDGIGSVLCCPRCGEENLHQENAKWFGRRYEDGDGYVVTVGHGEQPAGGTVENGAPHVVTAQMLPASAILGRRQSMVVEFTCEGCTHQHGVLHLVVKQHKGRTFICWQDI